MKKTNKKQEKRLNRYFETGLMVSLLTANKKQ